VQPNKPRSRPVVSRNSPLQSFSFTSLIQIGLIDVPYVMMDASRWEIRTLLIDTRESPRRKMDAITTG